MEVGTQHEYQRPSPVNTSGKHSPNKNSNIQSPTKVFSPTINNSHVPMSQSMRTYYQKSRTGVNKFRIINHNPPVESEWEEDSDLANYLIRK